MKKITSFALLVYALLPACGGPPFLTDGPAVVDALADPDRPTDALDAGELADVESRADVERPIDAHADALDDGDALSLDLDAHAEVLDAGDAAMADDAGRGVVDDAGDCVPRLGECGGRTYVGPTCCQAGLTCTVQSVSFSQCL